MQEVQPTPRAPAVSGVYMPIRRPGPAEQVPESGGSVLLFAGYLAIALDDGHLAIALLRGFTSALLTVRSHRACAPHREKVMSEVQPTLTILIQVPVQVLLWVFVGEQRLRPGPGEQAPGKDRAVLIYTGVAATGPRGGLALAPLDQATGIWRSGTTAEPDYIPGFYADVIPDSAMARPFTRPGLGTNCARRRIAAERMHALQMHTDPIPAVRIPAHCQPGERARLPRLRTVRPTAMACPTYASGQPASGRPRRDGVRQCGYLTIPPASASDARPAAQGFSLRYPRGN